MKVILLQEVKGKGGEGDVVDVARGFAVNYLFPRKMAVEATSGNLKQLEQRMHNIKAREESRVADAETLAASLEGKAVTITAKVGEEGRLYGSVTPTMIEDAIEEQLDVDVDRRRIDVHGHIKETGDHEVTVQVYRDIKAHVTVHVLGEGVEPSLVPAEEPEAKPEAEEIEAAEIEVAEPELASAAELEAAQAAEAAALDEAVEQSGTEAAEDETAAETEEP